MSRVPPSATGVRAVDRAFAALLQRLDPATNPDVLRAAELAMLAVSLGHAGVDLRQPQLLLEATPAAWPDSTQWQETLRASRWVATPESGMEADPAAPLVLEGGLLYLRRYREYERRLALGLLRIAAQPVPACDDDALAPLFATLFPEARSGDRQAQAAAQALRRSLLLVTGGPGTGKTTTIARVLLLLIAQARVADIDAPRMALAAPTGRAADRMAQSLRVAGLQLRDLGVDAALCDALPSDARTLHRLLGSIPGSPRFRHDASSPLPYDVIVVDEASMVDLPLMCKLVEAVAGGTRLLLLGDPDQLPSVEAGDVLAAIVAATGDDDALPGDLDGNATLATRLPAAVTPRTGDLFANTVIESPLAAHRVHLRRGYRQSETLDLAPLAGAVRDGDGDRVLHLLRDKASSGVHFHEGLVDPLRGTMRDALLAPWRALIGARDPAEALARASGLRLLTALRDGPQGANALNARIEELLAGPQRDPYFHGRLLLVTENSYRHGLFNGDIGVCLRGDDGGIVAWFQGGGDGARGFHPASLPAHDGAFAMTVHKAQGSEFDHVWLLLPQQDARTLSRELLYTALTRARSALHVCAGEAVLRAALSRHALRVSGLAARLRDASAVPR
jgi:exodeoxyribonuclease V alpha subunit